jgi:predicted RNase H-like HicB family nuclease
MPTTDSIRWMCCATRSRSWAATREQAAHNVADAIAQWIDEAGSLGSEIPMPKVRVTAA